MMIMPMSPLVKSSWLFQSACARLNPYDLRYHCGKQIPFYIHGRPILFLGHLGAYNINSPKMDTYVIEFITYPVIFTVFIHANHFKFKNSVAAFV
jgi:hypothetical protein